MINIKYSDLLLSQEISTFKFPLSKINDIAIDVQVQLLGKYFSSIFWSDCTRSKTGLQYGDVRQEGCGWADERAVGRKKR